MKNKTVYSLGHSNIDSNQFINILKDLEVKYLMDVRSNPNSCYIKDYDKDKFEKILARNKIRYTYCGYKVGGRQKIDFKKYVNTHEYNSAIKSITRIIDRGKSAIMCSEKDYKNCHRKYVSQTLLNNGYTVIQIKVDKNMNLSKKEQVPLTTMVR